jgi:CRP-like cAMP-binding protein
MLSALATEIRLAKGDVLFEQGDPGDSLFAVLEGALEVSVLSEDGRKLSLEMMTEGALFGEIALFDPGPRTATLTAFSEAKVLSIRNRDVLGAVRKTPELSADLIRLAGQRMRWMNMQISEQAFLHLPARLSRKLLHLLGDQDSTTLPMSQAALADYVGVSREAVSKTLAEWKRSEIVDLSRGEIRILNRAALETIAHPEAI